MTLKIEDLKAAADRFWNRVQKSEYCWNWIAGKSSGYGTLRVLGQNIKAHRFSYLIHKGEIPAHDSYHGLVVMHKCDNPACVNPEHLELGTCGDNNRDRHIKGRTKNIEEGRAEHHAAQRAITHCPEGHEYSGSNVRYRKNGARYCGECYRLRCAKYTEKHGDERNARRRLQRKLKKGTFQ